VPRRWEKLTGVSRTRVGVRRSGVISKRDLLLFDRIWIMGLDTELERLRDIDAQHAADLAYLAEEGRVLEAPDTASGLADAIRHGLADELQPLLEELDLTEIEWPSGDGTRRDLLLEAEILASSGRHPSSRFLDASLPRGGELLVAFLTRLLGDDATAVLDRSLSREEWRFLSSGIVIPKSLRGMDAHARVIEIVTGSLPLPSDDTPLEAVLDFVDDPEVRAKAEALRLWMRRTADIGVTAKEIELELETLLHDFRRHMELHRLRSRNGALRAAIAVPLGFAEELMHLRPRRAADALFAVRDRRAARLEAELTAPGHEVAYIETATQHFS
jgi:hypothetical protein